MECTSFTECDFDGNNREDLNLHLETNHKNPSNEGPIAGNFILTEFFCKVCEFTAESDADLSEHIRDKHTTCYNCGTCDYNT